LVFIPLDQTVFVVSWDFFFFSNVLSVNGLTLLSALSASVEAFQSEIIFEKKKKVIFWSASRKLKITLSGFELLQCIKWLQCLKMEFFQGSSNCSKSEIYNIIDPNAFTSSLVSKSSALNDYNAM